MQTHRIYNYTLRAQSRYIGITHSTGLGFPISTIRAHCWNDISGFYIVITWNGITIMLKWIPLQPTTHDLRTLGTHTTAPKNNTSNIMTDWSWSRISMFLWFWLLLLSFAIAFRTFPFHSMCALSYIMESNCGETARVFYTHSETHVQTVYLMVYQNQQHNTVFLGAYTHCLSAVWRQRFSAVCSVVGWYRCYLIMKTARSNSHYFNADECDDRRRI